MIFNLCIEAINKYSDKIDIIKMDTGIEIQGQLLYLELNLKRYQSKLLVHHADIFKLE